LCNKLLHKLVLPLIETIEPLHVVQIAPGKPFDATKFLRKVPRNLLDNRIAPAGCALLLSDELAELPVQADELGIDRPRRFDLGRLDLSFQRTDEIPIFRRSCNVLFHGTVLRDSSSAGKH
jgi:hypothetical protein